MAHASLKRSPVAPLRATRSLPARSTRLRAPCASEATQPAASGRATTQPAVSQGGGARLERRDGPRGHAEKRTAVERGRLSGRQRKLLQRRLATGAPTTSDGGHPRLQALARAGMLARDVEHEDGVAAAAGGVHLRRLHRAHRRRAPHLPRIVAQPAPCAQRPALPLPRPALPCLWCRRIPQPRGQANPETLGQANPETLGAGESRNPGGRLGLQMSWAEWVSREQGEAGQGRWQRRWQRLGLGRGRGRGLHASECAAATDGTGSRWAPVISVTPSAVCTMACLSLCVEPGRSRSRT